MWFLYVLWWVNSLLSSVLYQVEIDILDTNRTLQVLQDTEQMTVSVELSKVILNFNNSELSLIESLANEEISYKVRKNMAAYLYQDLIPLSKDLDIDVNFLVESVDEGSNCSSLTVEAKEKLPNFLEKIVFNSSQENLLLTTIFQSYQLQGLCLEQGEDCGVFLTESFLRSKFFHSQNTTENELNRSCELQQEFFSNLIDIENKVNTVDNLSFFCLLAYIVVLFLWTLLFNYTAIFDFSLFTYIIFTPILISIYQGILCLPLIISRYLNFLDLKSLFKELTQQLNDEEVLSQSFVINLDSILDTINLLLRVDSVLVFFAAACAAILGLILSIFLFIYIQFLHFMNTGFIEPFILREYYRVE
eukprot:snap_masked-scaffold_9-processed-gene-11.44-mRNA-1 protein AED:1.00 eAED:1.00 QI:0/0/0/0/1/1/2/0/360